MIKRKYPVQKLQKNTHFAFFWSCIDDFTIKNGEMSRKFSEKCQTPPKIVRKNISAQKRVITSREIK